MAKKIKERLEKMKRSRPCKHLRRIRTKRGIKRIVINPKIKKRVTKRRRNYGMAIFSNSQEDEIKRLDLNKRKYLGEGEHGSIFGLNDNYIIKREKQKGFNKKESSQYEKVKSNPIIIPSYNISEGIIRPKLKIKTRGATKGDWNNPDIDRKGYLVIEDKNLSDAQAKKIISGLNELSESGFSIGDELQVGTDKKDDPFIYDIGEIYKTKNARDDNDEYKGRFLEAIDKSHLFDRDRKKEQEEAEYDIMNFGKK